MKSCVIRLACSLGLLFCIPMPFAHAGEGGRVIRGVVLNVDGSPAPGRQVSLVGLSRGAMRIDMEERGFKGWDFTTDKDGAFTASLDGAGRRDLTDPRPGPGTYVFIVLPSDSDAGAVSPHLLNSTERPSEYEERNNEWGKYLTVPPTGMDLRLQIMKGITLKGRVVKYPEGKEPMAGLGVNIFHDLYAGTHTGYGGEIFPRSAVTDARGNFEISHIYPSKFFVSLCWDYGNRGGTWDATWLKTKTVGGKWIFDAVSGQVPRAGHEVVEIEIMAAEKPSFQYSGVVKDASGNPVAGAEVRFGLSYHKVPRTWADYHHGESTVTKPDGSYEILLSTPWVRGMAVEAAGYERADRWDPDDNSSYTPGTYDFVLKRQPPGK